MHCFVRCRVAVMNEWLWNGEAINYYYNHCAISQQIKWQNMRKLVALQSACNEKIIIITKQRKKENNNNELFRVALLDMTIQTSWLNMCTLFLHVHGIPVSGQRIRIYSHLMCMFVCTFQFSFKQFLQLLNLQAILLPLISDWSIELNELSELNNSIR